MFTFAVLSLISILFQGIVVYLSYQLFKLVKPIRVWTRAWAMSGLGMGLVALRRAWSLIIFLKETNLATGNCPVNLADRYVEVALLLIISALWIGFIYSLKNIFVKYLGPYSGDSVLLEREDVIEHREDTVLGREDVAGKREGIVGKREVAVQVRENKQKSSPYYEDPEKILRKIVNGK